MTQDQDTIFEGFQKFYCEDFTEGIELECRAWSRKLPTDGVIVDGWPRWEDNRQVVFFWFDGGETANDDKYYPKISTWTSEASYTGNTNTENQPAITLSFSGASFLTVAAAGLTTLFA